jgi:hypothetical protein
MKKLILAAAVVLVAVGFAANSKEQVVNAPEKAQVIKQHQDDVNKLQGTSSSKEAASWD